MRQPASIISKHFRKRLFAVLILLLIFSSYTSDYRTSDKNYHLDGKLPGTVKIGANFFCDKNEISNEAWVEYIYWSKFVFGANSEEYKSSLPDTNVWNEIYPCLNWAKEVKLNKKAKIVTAIPFSQYYFRHPAYRDYPVVGVTRKQALEYSKWRSDRVFEMILIKHNKIQMHPYQNRNNYFTIEKYLSGNYLFYEPDSNFRFYPNYRLPSLKEWRYIKTYADSIDNAYYKKHKNRKCDYCKTSWADCQINIVPCNHDTLLNFPTAPVYAYEKASPISNLTGNVSEWTSENEICAGGGWVDSMERIISSDTFHLKTQNAWTGFRNVCEWKEWEK